MLNGQFSSKKSDNSDILDSLFIIHSVLIIAQFYSYYCKSYYFTFSEINICFRGNGAYFYYLCWVSKEVIIITISRGVVKLIIIVTDKLCEFISNIPSLLNIVLNFLCLYCLMKTLKFP